MKNIFIFIFLFFTSQLNGQELFLNLLDSLSVNDIKVHPNKIDTVCKNNYFEVMQKKQNFLFPDFNKKILYLNSYRQYSIFAMVDDNTFSKQNCNESTPLSPRSAYKAGLLFDHKKNHCYYLKYSSITDGDLLVFEFIERNDLVSVGADSHFDICILTRLDQHFNPLYGTALGDNFYSSSSSRINKPEEFSVLYIFKKRDSITHYNLAEIPRISINTTTIETLTDLLSDQIDSLTYTQSQESFLLDIESFFNPTMSVY